MLLRAQDEIKVRSPLSFALLFLASSLSKAEPPVSESYGWTDIGGGWYSSKAYGEVFLEDQSVEGAWGWSEMLEGWVFCPIDEVRTESHCTFLAPWDNWFTALDRGSQAVFPRPYLSELTDAVQAAIESGILLEGASEGKAWVLANPPFESSLPQTRAYASVLNGAVWANSEASRIASARFQSASSLGQKEIAGQMLVSLSQAIAQSLVGITQALSQSIMQGESDPRDIDIIASDYALAYRLLTDGILRLVEENTSSQAQALSQSLTGLGQALSQGYLGITQALGQGYAGLQAARQSGLSTARLEDLETDFRLVTDSYTFNYASEAASLATAVSRFQGEPIVPQNFVAFTQTVSQSHVGATQSIAQSYLGVTQALFERAGSGIGND